jgi:uncharacterized protein HemX
MDTTPNTNQGQPVPPSGPRPNTTGPIIGIIIIILVLLVGGLYFWGERIDEVSDDVEELQETNESDEIADIEADLEEDFQEIDAELEQFETDLEASEGGQ